jgi:hypothetical protein
MRTGPEALWIPPWDIHSRDFDFFRTALKMAVRFSPTAAEIAVALENHLGENKANF